MKSPPMFDTIQSRIEYNKLLSPFTSWKVGGTAEMYFAPKSVADVIQAIAYANYLQKPIFVLGRGSNVLIDDVGLPGLTLHLWRSFQDVVFSTESVLVGAGVALPKLAKITSERGYTGFEFMAGIPGTVGAAVLVNAGAGTEEIKDKLLRIWYLDRWGTSHEVAVEDLALGYRSSKYWKSPIVVTQAEFVLGDSCSIEICKMKIQNLINKRREKFPLNLPSAGSTFKRPQFAQSPPAGYLLETAGMKGYRINDAMVSELHANWIVNLGNATATDIGQLIDVMRAKVFEVHHIELEREVIYFPQDSHW